MDNHMSSPLLQQKKHIVSVAVAEQIWFPDNVYR